MFHHEHVDNLGFKFVKMTTYDGLAFTGKYQESFPLQVRNDIIVEMI